jgi:hypothetical protein
MRERKSQMPRYHVKFQWKGKTRFGIVERTGEAEEAAKQGFLIIADAVTPERFKVNDDATVVDIPEHRCPRWDWRTGRCIEGSEFDMYLDDQHLRAEKADKQAREDAARWPMGVYPGALFGVGVADGTAWYVVKSVGKTTCRIEWRGFCPDRYIHLMFGYGGSFRIRDVAVFCRTI